MATLGEILYEIEQSHQRSVAAINDNFMKIIANNRDAYNCLQARLEQVAKTTIGFNPSDISIVVDRSDAMVQSFAPMARADIEALEEKFLDTLVEELNPRESGNRIDLVTYPVDGSDDTWVDNATTNQHLSGGEEGDQLAVAKFTLEPDQGAGHRPIGDGIHVAMEDFRANGRPGVDRIMIIVVTGQSSYKEGYGTNSLNPVAEAELARREGVRTYVISVGPDVDHVEALQISAYQERTIHVDDPADLLYTIDTLKARLAYDFGTFVNCIPHDVVLSPIPSLNINP